MGTTISEVGPKTFTLVEANALIPWLSAVFTEVRADVDELLARRSWEGVSRAQRGISHPEESDGRVLELEERIQSLLREVGSVGVEVRRVDGMVDFPSWRDGELVYLCWRLGEPKVLHWHTMHSGWPERRRLETDGDPMTMVNAGLAVRESEIEL